MAEDSATREATNPKKPKSGAWRLWFTFMMTLVSQVLNSIVSVRYIVLSMGARATLGLILGISTAIAGMYVNIVFLYNTTVLRKDPQTLSESERKKRERLANIFKFFTGLSFLLTWIGGTIGVYESVVLLTPYYPWLNIKIGFLNIIGAFLVVIGSAGFFCYADIQTRSVLARIRAQKEAEAPSYKRKLAKYFSGIGMILSVVIGGLYAHLMLPSFSGEVLTVLMSVAVTYIGAMVIWNTADPSMGSAKTPETSTSDQPITEHPSPEPPVRKHKIAGYSFVGVTSLCIGVTCVGVYYQSMSSVAVAGLPTNFGYALTATGIVGLVFYCGQQTYQIFNRITLVNPGAMRGALFASPAYQEEVVSGQSLASAPSALPS